jgi:hypothetical protein
VADVAGTIDQQLTLASNEYRAARRATPSPLAGGMAPVQAASPMIANSRMNWDQFQVLNRAWHDLPPEKRRQLIGRYAIPRPLKRLLDHNAGVTTPDPAGAPPRGVAPAAPAAPPTAVPPNIRALAPNLPTGMLVVLARQWPTLTPAQRGDARTRLGLDPRIVRWLDGFAR